MPIADGIGALTFPLPELMLVFWAMEKLRKLTSNTVHFDRWLALGKDV